MSEQESSNSLTSTTGKESSNLVAKESGAKAIHPAMEGLVQMTMIKQVGLMLGLAFSVAIGVAVVLWSQAPAYDLLFSNLGEQDAAEILEALDKLDVPYKIDQRSGAVMVVAGKVRDIKLKLAAEGLPRSNSLGYELLDKEASFTTSKSVETMRFQRALEGEIARTVMTIQNIKSARVLLALPKQSVFVRKQKKPSASVIVNLYRGRALEKGQIDAIVHLVASSVPLMEASQVTVVDQQGRLLSSNDTDSNLALTNKQFDYKKEVEDHLMARIENILMPIVGREGMRVQISAEVDFTVTEQTQEMFNPDLPALRSEQTTEDLSSLSAVQGVPGALSNQPPSAAVAPEIAAGEGSSSAQTPLSSSKATTRNFELDKTITHSRLASGVVRRLSVAVVIDDKRILTAEGTISNLPFAQEDLNRLTELVKRAIGYDMRRGDKVTLTNAAFRVPDELEVLPAEPLWEQAWFIDLIKQLAAAVVVLFIVFGVLRPTMRGLVAKEEEQKDETEIVLDKNGIPVAVPVRYDEKGQPIPVKLDADGHALSSETEDLLLLEPPQSYEKRLEYVKKIVDEDPKLVAQVLKGWINQDG